MTRHNQDTIRGNGDDCVYISIRMCFAGMLIIAGICSFILLICSILTGEVGYIIGSIIALILCLIGLFGAFRELFVYVLFVTIAKLIVILVYSVCERPPQAKILVVGIFELLVCIAYCVALYAFGFGDFNLC